MLMRYGQVILNIWMIKITLTDIGIDQMLKKSTARRLLNSVIMKYSSDTPQR